MDGINKNTIKPRDYSQLSADDIHSILLDKENQLHEQKTQIKTLSEKLHWFEEQFKLLKSKHYAKSSEKQTAFQCQLFDEDEDVTQSETQASNQEAITYTRNKPQRKDKHLDTSQLPRERRTIELNEQERQCDCGRCFEPFGEETKEELEFKPATLKVIEHVRIKYTCRHCETVKMPKAVELPLSKSKAGASLLADILINKYENHLPLYRQSKILARYPIDIPDNTLGGWVMGAAERLEPLSDAFWLALKEVKALQVDETPVKVLQPEKKAYMWLYHSYLPDKRFVIYDFNLSRASTVVNERLKHFQGLLQTDGYSGYATQRKRNDIISLGCFDHARRKFTDVIKVAGNNKSGKAGKMLEKIAKLYDIERRIKNLPFDERKAIRQQEAKPKLESIYLFLNKIHAPPNSLLGKAATYMKNQWPELIRYIDYGKAQISNCWVENQVRPFALGRRNWLFVGNELSASRAALIYSLIQSCKLNDINPRIYLEYVLNQVHSLRRGEVNPAELLPHTIDKSLITL